MLRELHIKDFALIERLSVSFERGLNVLTGETGAGKSIIVDALGAALGLKAAPEMVRSGSAQASVEAVFEAGPGAAALLEELGIGGGQMQGELIIRRTIPGAGGKSRAFINDTTVSIQSLLALGGLLVDIHGQHEHQSLLRPEAQLASLDEASGLAETKKAYKDLYERARDLRKKLRELKEAGRERAQRLDLLSYQINEIDAAGLAPGEEESLINEKKILSNTARLRDLIEGVYAVLYGEDVSALQMLGRAKTSMEEIARIDPQAEEALRHLVGAIPLIEEAAIFARSRRDGYELDPERLNDVEERLELIRKLKRKYGESVQAILDLRAGAALELERLSTLEENTAALERELALAEEALMKAAGELSAKRREGARKTGKEVSSILAELAFPHAEFGINLEATEPGPEGADRVEFVFSANPGEPSRPLARVASGGELSRLMLALKCVLRAGGVPVLIFDEVDAGTGGKTAHSIASKLKELSRTHQVLCITHLPQIASAANAHYLIEKKPAADRTAIEVKKVEGGQREEEIARMLSGTLTGTSLKHARELIQGRLGL